MAQHDYDIANQSGSSFRSDLNNCLDAVQSQNSGSSAPSTTVAFMPWADTNANLIKFRNAANDGFITLCATDGTFPAKTFTGDVTLNAQSDLRFADSDSSNWVAFQAPATVSSNVTWTLPDADATSSGQALVSDGSGTLSWATAGGGDISDTAPERTFTNTTQEDTDGGRESKLTFKGEQSGGEVSTLAQIEAHHDGTSDDEKGQIVFRTNDGSDGSSPTDRVIIDSAGNVAIGGTSASQKLDVTGTAWIRGDVRLTTGNDLQLQNSAGNQQISINADDATASYTVTLPPTAPSTTGQVLSVASGTTDAELEWADAGGGKILQVVTQNDTDKLLITSGSAVYTSATITPSATTSKILIIHNCCYSGTNNQYGGIECERQISGGASTDINTGVGGDGTFTHFSTSCAPIESFAATSTDDYKMNVTTFMLEDSPSTTSAVTYEFTAITDASNRTIGINRSVGGGSNGYNPRGCTTTTLMEVSA